MSTETVQPLPDPQEAFFPAPKQYRAFVQLLEAWERAELPTQPGNDYRFDVATLVANARAALKCGSTPYVTLLLTVAPAFLSHEDRELEVLEVDDD